MYEWAIWLFVVAQLTELGNCRTLETGETRTKIAHKRRKLINLPICVMLNEAHRAKNDGTCRIFIDLVSQNVCKIMSISSRWAEQIAKYKTSGLAARPRNSLVGVSSTQQCGNYITTKMSVPRTSIHIRRARRFV